MVDIKNTLYRVTEAVTSERGREVATAVGLVAAGTIPLAYGVIADIDAFVLATEWFIGTGAAGRDSWLVAEVTPFIDISELGRPRSFRLGMDFLIGLPGTIAGGAAYVGAAAAYFNRTTNRSF